MARDILHSVVREVLLNDGWTITHDPYAIRVKGRNYEVDLGAEQLLAAERESVKIAVEVKSFLMSSFSYEFHAVLGQYLNCKTFMEIQEPARVLYLAVPGNIYEKFFVDEATQLIVNKFRLNLVIFDVETQTVLQWILK